MSLIFEEQAKDQHSEAPGFVAFARPWGVHVMHDFPGGVVALLITPEKAVSMADDFLDIAGGEEGAVNEYEQRFAERASWLLRSAAERSASGRKHYQENGFVNGEEE